MRICHVLDYYQPQLGYHDAFLAKVQCDDGHDVHVITGDRYRPFDHYDETVGPLLGPRFLSAGMTVDGGVSVHRLPIRAETHYRVWLVGLERVLNRLQPDFVYVHGVSSFSAMRVVRLKPRATTDFVLVIDDHMVPSSQPSVPYRFFYAFLRKFYTPFLRRQADVLVAVTEATGEFMRDQYGLADEEITQVPLGADTSLFRHSEGKRAEFRRRHSIAHDDVLVIHCGKLTPEKAPHLLVDAAIQLIGQGDPLRVLLIGDGPAQYLADMQLKIRTAGYERAFIWLSSVPNAQLPGFYSAADVAVWPARSSLSMIEAQAVGLPIIVSDFPAAAERVRFGNGLVFAQGDVAELAESISALIRNPDQRRLLGDEGRRHVVENWDYRAISRRLLALGGLA